MMRVAIRPYKLIIIALIPGDKVNKSNKSKRGLIAMKKSDWLVGYSIGCHKLIFHVVLTTKRIYHMCPYFICIDLLSMSF